MTQDEMRQAVVELRKEFKGKIPLNFAFLELYDSIFVFLRQVLTSVMDNAKYINKSMRSAMTIASHKNVVLNELIRKFINNKTVLRSVGLTLVVLLSVVIYFVLSISNTSISNMSYSPVKIVV
ncbi:MAG: hypothetical protein KatS3mg083_427 [Candidatus Dojkabacteria bacterium]|nr:MAG: hypothetical protein KatS3mg083_427 [Candidatus Dojkabacteria bacterium]